MERRMLKILELVPGRAVAYPVYPPSTLGGCFRTPKWEIAVIARVAKDGTCAMLSNGRCVGFYWDSMIMERVTNLYAPDAEMEKDTKLASAYESCRKAASILDKCRNEIESCSDEDIIEMASAAKTITDVLARHVYADAMENGGDE